MFNKNQIPNVEKIGQRYRKITNQSKLNYFYQIGFIILYILHKRQHSYIAIPHRKDIFEIIFWLVFSLTFQRKNISKFSEKQIVALTFT